MFFVYRFLILFLIITSFVMAEEKLKVQIFDSHILPSDLEAKHISVNPGVTPKTELVAISQRDNFYLKFSKLNKLSNTMDQVDRDILWVRLKSKSPHELVQYYPEISEAEFAQFQKEMP